MLNPSSSSIKQYFNLGWCQTIKRPSCLLHNFNNTWHATAKKQRKISALASHKSKYKHTIVSAYSSKSMYNSNSMIKIITMACSSKLKIRRAPYSLKNNCNKACIAAPKICTKFSEIVNHSPTYSLSA